MKRTSDLRYQRFCSRFRGEVGVGCVCECVVGGGVQTPPSSSVFEHSMLHSMASGIQIAIKGLSVSSWCSIDLQRESNPDYEVQ